MVSSTFDLDAITYSYSPPCLRRRDSRAKSLLQLPQRVVRLTLQHVRDQTSRSSFQHWVLNLDTDQVKNACQELVADNLYHPRCADWLIDWIHLDPIDETNRTLIHCSSLILGHLAFPEELVPSIRDQLFQRGAIGILLKRIVEFEISLSPHIKETDLCFKEIIGSGAGGTVFKGTWNGMPVAIKNFKHQDFWKASKEEFLFELGLISIFGCYKYFVSCLGANVRKGLIVMPLLSGSLDTLFDNGTISTLSWNRKLKIAWMIAKAMKCLHEFSILHRDLKPANILLDDQLNCYLCDFGIAREIVRKRSNTLNMGTTSYMAPEMFEGNGLYSKAVDVFSFGMILWQLASNQPNPYLNLIPLHEIPDFIISSNRLEIPLTVPEYFRDCIARCWHQNPKCRPNFDLIVAELEKYQTPSTPGR